MRTQKPHRIFDWQPAFGIAALCLVLPIGCSDPMPTEPDAPVAMDAPPVDAPRIDAMAMDVATGDGGTDAPSPLGDAAVPDVSMSTPDVPMSLPDTGSDAGAIADAGFDAGRDAGFDAGRDAGFDAGRDSGVDTGRDTGSCRALGESCSPMASCCSGVCSGAPSGTCAICGVFRDRCSPTEPCCGGFTCSPGPTGFCI